MRRVCGSLSKPEREPAIATSDYRVNQDIRVHEVRLITETNDNVGVVPIEDALDRARKADLDLVEVAPNADPPVCKIMDFGKFLYAKAKKEREARKQQKQIEVKEIRLRPKTSGHHLEIKVRNARRWLGDGMKVKVRIQFRAREITYPEIGREILDTIANQVADIGVVEQWPNMEGSTMLMVLAPVDQKKK
ncbi:MAG: translation initiation factor IF-3 [Anaerolineae bacterium]|nr:translation initiation factor IF-3 [Anaerolineae bacterium]